MLVVYNHYDLTRTCLEHLDRQTAPHNLIICDNGSTDGTFERLQADWPAARLLRLEHNSPFAVACNMGVKAGTGDFVVLLNNDVQCRQDFLEAAVAPLLADPAVGSVATLMLQPGEQLIDSFGMRCDPTLAGFQRLHGHPTVEADPTDPVLIGPPGTATAYRRTAWEQVGGLDEHFFAYGEDFDLALRLGSAGWRTVAAVEAVGVHLGSATHRHRSSRQRYHGGFARGYLLRRYGVLRSRQALRALLTEGVVVIGDLVISRDTAAFRGRLAGWRAAGGLPRLSRPPDETIDHSIGLASSLALRRGVYGRRAA